MKKVKLILPAFAFLFAIGASLASLNAKGNLATQDVSLPTGTCAKIGTCTTGGTSLCNNGSVNVIRYNAGTCGTTFNGTFD